MAKKASLQVMKPDRHVPFPNFFVIGAHKAGTTALYSCLKQHPDIYMSPVKEPHFFTFKGEVPVFAGAIGAGLRRIAVQRPKDYLMLFTDANGQSAIGEASTSYLWSAEAAAKIKRYLPGAKIIVLLRQPADRAYSNYQFLRSHGAEPVKNFAEALAQENLRRKDGWYPLFFYRQMGYYYDNLRRYLDLFPSEQVKIYLYEEWNSSPHKILPDLFHFLGVDDHFVPEIHRSNVTLLARSNRLNRLAKKPERTERLLAPLVPAPLRKNIISAVRALNEKYNLYRPEPINPEIRRQLTAEYREDIFKLQDLIGRGLSHWLT